MFTFSLAYQEGRSYCTALMLILEDV